MRIKPLALGSFITLLSLMLFLYLQSRRGDVLDLELKWIGLSLIPLAISLILGGHLQEFKGFGIELKAKLESPVRSINLKALGVAREIREESKQDCWYLDRLDDDEKNRILRLSFIEGKRDYYHGAVIANYLEQLSNLEFFEIKNEQGEFICLLPSALFKKGDEYDWDLLSKFVNAINNRNVLEEFEHDAINYTIDHSVTIAEALKGMKNNNCEVAVVTDNNGIFMGILEATQLEKIIVRDVLSSL